MITNTDKKPEIRNLSLDELTGKLLEMKQPKFRATQIYEWLHKKLVTSFDDMTNISKELRATLQENFSLSTPKELLKQTSIDGSRKYLIQFPDGTSVECVGMPSHNKLSVCISSQAGCGMGCVFCATGENGLQRSLSTQEIIDQVYFVQHDFNQSVTNVVFMGQGEPFTNYDNVMKALRILNSKNGLMIGARHLTVSTCGVIPSITKFTKEPEQFTLAISLHSAIQETRNYLMPGVKRWNLVHLQEAVKNYAATTGRRPSYEYAMIKDVNDSEVDLQALCDFCKDTLCHVNLIGLNEIPGSKFHPTSKSKMTTFQKRLQSVGVETTVRNSRGSDIDAACGQLKQRRDKNLPIL